MVVPLNHRTEKDKGNQDRSWAIKFETVKQEMLCQHTAQEVPTRNPASKTQTVPPGEE